VREAFAEHQLAKHQFAKHCLSGPPGKRQKRRLLKDALYVQLTLIKTRKKPRELRRKSRR
jgi:hypothetical protein